MKNRLSIESILSDFKMVLKYKDKNINLKLSYERKV